MAHVAKYTKGGAVRLTMHYERRQDEKGDYIKFGNQDIDLSRTHENYNLAPVRPGGQLAFIKKRCSEVQCMNRDNVNVLCDWVVTLPKDLPEEKKKDFFSYTYDFLEKRYGPENVVSAYVHKDETTPHLHFAFIPVVEDKKTGQKKVSAKECLNRGELRSFHKELSEALMLSLGCWVSILNEATREGNKSIQQLKQNTALEAVKAIQEKAIQEAEQEAKAIREKAVQEAARDVEKVRTSILPLREEKNGLEANISQLTAALRSANELPQGKKAKIGNNIILTPEEFQKLRSTAQAYFSEQGKRLEAERVCQRFKVRCSEVEKNSFENEYRQANSDNIALRTEIIRIQRAIDSLPLPDEMKHRVQRGQSVKQKKPHEKSRDYER